MEDKSTEEGPRSHFEPMFIDFGSRCGIDFSTFFEKTEKLDWKFRGRRGNLFLNIIIYIYIYIYMYIYVYILLYIYIYIYIYKYI